MEIIYDSYLVNEKLKRNRLAFNVMEITIFAINYTRFKVYIFIPYLHFPNYPQKIIDFTLEKGEE